MTKTGATVQELEMFYKAVVQMVLLYGIESWVVMQAMLKVTKGFHYQVTQRIEGVSSQRVVDEVCE